MEASTALSQGPGSSGISDPQVPPLICDGSDAAGGFGLQPFRELADAMPQMVWVARADGYHQYFNQRWYQYTGSTAEDSLGEGWISHLNPDEHEQIRQRWRHSLQTGEPYEIEYRIRRASDGTYRWHLGRALPQHDQTGRIVQWYGTCTDVHDQKRVRDSSRFLAQASAILAGSLDFEATLRAVAALAVPQLADWCAIDLADTDGNIRRIVLHHRDPARLTLAHDISERFKHRFGKSDLICAILLTGQSKLVSLISPELIEAATENADHARLIEALGLRSLIWVPMTAGGKSLGAIALATAETDRHYDAADLQVVEDLARRAALAVDNARLYRETRENQEQLKRFSEEQRIGLVREQAARAQAEAANRAKDKFLAVLSHELRTPLTALLLASTELESEASASPRLRELVDVIRRNADLEARLIDDLLDVTRIARGKLEIRRRLVDLHELLDHALKTCSGSDIEEKNLRVSVDAGAQRHHVWGDPARLQQVLWNLIMNAAKFTPAGGSIDVQTTDEEGRIRVSIADTGIGIDPEALPRIFNAFEQVDRSITRQFGGLGLGLAICKALVELHGGRIGAQSEGLGQGATFTLELPVVTADLNPRGADQAPETVAAPPGRGVSILLVEDHADTANIMSRLLSRRGYAVRVASRLSDALRLADETEFDVLISDIGLPDGSGLDLIQRLAQRRPIKGIALSGFGMEEDLERSRAAGFTEHLTKPIDFKQLESVIARLAGREVSPAASTTAAAS